MPSPIRILVVADAVFPDDYGGSARVSWELSKSLSEAGHRVTILTIGKHRERKKNRDDETYEGRVIRLINLKNITRIFRLSGVDLVIISSPLSGFIYYLFCRKKESSIVYLFHSPWAEEYKIRSRDIKRFLPFVGYISRKYIEHFLLSRASKIVVLSRFMKEKVIELHKIKQDKIYIVPAGVDLKKFRPAENSPRKILGLPEDKLILLTVRNLVSRMGIENLILAMRSIKRKNKNIYLIIGGEGYLKEKLKNLTKNLELDNYVKFVDRIPDGHLPLYYQSADLFILPTRELEGFGLVILESLACGTPVLATPVGAIPEILEKFDKNFILRGAEPEDISDGVNKIVKILAKGGFKNKNLKGRCRRFVEENYSWEKFAHSIIKFYEAEKEEDSSYNNSA